MGVIENPGGAFGYDGPQTPDGGYETRHYVAGGTVVAGDAVQVTGTLGRVISQLTNSTHAFFRGVALEGGESGDTILVSRGGPVTVNKHDGAALTAGNFVGRSVTTAGEMALVTNASAVTQAKDLGIVQGIVLADAASDATTVVIDLTPL